MNICGGKVQTNGHGVRMTETWRPERPQGCPLGAYLSINKEKEIYTDVPKIHGKQLADIPVSKESVVVGRARVRREEAKQSTGVAVARDEQHAAHRS